MRRTKVAGGGRTQLIQELIADGCHGVTRYQPECDKIMRLHAQTAMIENGFFLDFRTSASLNGFIGIVLGAGCF